MSKNSPAEVANMLCAASSGDGSALKKLIPLVYDELRAIAASYLRREPAEHTLQPTALVNEAYLKLVDQKRVDWRGRAHFIAVGAQAMRRILVDHARARQREKRGGGRRRLPLDEDFQLSTERDEDVIALDEALRKLSQLDERQARIVELRFFGGLTVQEAAEVLGVSKRTVEAEWTMVRAWLRRELSEEGPS